MFYDVTASHRALGVKVVQITLDRIANHSHMMQN